CLRSTPVSFEAIGLAPETLFPAIAGARSFFYSGCGSRGWRMASAVNESLRTRSSAMSASALSELSDRREPARHIDSGDKAEHECEHQHIGYGARERDWGEGPQGLPAPEPG